MKSVSMTLEQLLGSKRTKSTQQAAPVLGGRELDVMKILWRDGEQSAQAVLDILQSNSSSGLSLSTVQSTLERLHRKTLVSRQKTGRYYVYRAAISRSAIISQLLGDIAQQFGEGDLAPMLSGFASFIDQERAHQDEQTLPSAILEAMQPYSDTNGDQHD